MNSLTRQQVRGIDRYAIDKLGIPGVVLMENAGRNTADAIEEFFFSTAGKTVAIVAGVGNNGGDGFVIARHLANRGARVVTFLVAPEDRIKGDARVNLDIIRGLGHDIRAVGAEELGGFDLIVDAAGGTGISGPLRGELADAVEQINAAGASVAPVVAVDIPTGLDCDTGLAPGPAVRAKLTVTFLARKAGFDNPASAEYTGLVRVADIGIDAEQVAKIAAG